MKKSLSLFLIGSLLGIAVSANAQTTAADSTMLSAYVGIYTFGSGSPVQKYIVTTEKGNLYGEADSNGKNKLLKQEKADTFKSTSSYGSIITFLRDATTKAVTGFGLDAQGTELTAQKDKP